MSEAALPPALLRSEFIASPKFQVPFRQRQHPPAYTSVSLETALLAGDARLLAPGPGTGPASHSYFNLETNRSPRSQGSLPSQDPRQALAQDIDFQLQKRP